MMKMKLNNYEFHKFLLNIQIFLLPLAINYLGMVSLNLQVEGNIVDITDFMPNSFVLGGFTVYIQNTLIDYVRKLKK